MALKVEAKGGKGGNQWDDGFHHEGVTKIYVRGGREGIQFIKFEYVKDGKTIVGPIHGVSGLGMTQTFEINHSDKEYLLSVDGYYDKSTGVIQSIEFKTNKKTSDIMGFNDGTKFSLSVTGKKIIGFHGFSEKHLNSLGAYFINLPPMKSEVGGAKNTGNIFDDGSDFDGVRKVYVTCDNTKIRHIKVDYDKAGQVVSREHGEKTGTQHEFEIDYPSEYLAYVEGTYAITQPYETDVLHSLTFKTSKGRTSPIIGKPAGSFVLQSEGNAIVGFHGRCGGSVDGIGAYYSPLHSSPLEKLKALGGEGRNQWDDGFDYENVTKIHVRAGLQGIQFIKFEYFKAGKTIVGPIHGVSGRGMTQTFEIDHLDTEYLLSVEGYYDESTGVIQTIQFKTNKKDSDLMGFNPGSKFSLRATGKKIIGFHGFSGNNLNSLGAYFIKHPPIKSEIGGAINTGNIFDDGGEYDGVRKVYVSYDNTKIRHIKFDYDKAGQVVSREHGEKTGTQYEFKVDYPSEYITSVEGTYAITLHYKTYILRSLTFKTSKGRTSPVIGRPAGSFVLGSEGNAIVGFHGRCGGSIDGIGAYYSPLPQLEKLEEQGGEGEKSPLPPTPLTPSFKLPAIGGNGRVSWDDGEHNNVRKVYVGQGDSGVAFVKFDYDKESELLAGDGHGKMSLLGTEEFEVDPDDYITSVQVYYEKIYGLDTEIITALIFKTFKGIISQPFGMTSGDMFFLEGGKITGFHGTSSDVLHSIGAYMSLSPTPMLRGKWIQVEQKGKGPGPRCSQAISMVGDKMYSFGGELTPNLHIDQHLYVLDFKTHTWSIATPNGDVPDLACLGVTMVAIGTTLYVFGGRDGHRNYNGFYSYDTVKSEWKLLTHVNKGPEPRSFHSMAYDDENVYVFGGVSKTARLNTLHAYNIKDQKWVELPNPGDSCTARGGPGLAVVQGKIWVVYGFSGVEMDDVHCFDPVESKWTKMETKGEKPWARSVFAIAVLGKYIIMSGGETDMDPKGHFGPGKLTSAAFVLDTESLMWEKLEEGHSPRGWCASTTALIDGKKGLLMYGGKSLTNDRYEDILFYGVDSA